MILVEAEGSPGISRKSMIISARMPDYSVYRISCFEGTREELCATSPNIGLRIAARPRMQTSDAQLDRSADAEPQRETVSRERRRRSRVHCTTGYRVVARLRTRPYLLAMAPTYLEPFPR
jgi:hypothetical protein